MSEEIEYALIGVDLDTFKVVQMASMKDYFLDNARDMIREDCFPVMLPIKELRKIGGTTLAGENHLRALMLSVTPEPSQQSELSLMRERVRELEYTLGQIVNDLPQSRDWLNPDIERQARALLSTGSEEG